jgi:hypothetical protein
MKKLQAAPNTTVECPRDGPVRAQVLEWNLVLAGDDTGEVMLTIPPSVGRVPSPGEVIAAEGTLTEQEEFIVWRYSTAEAKLPAAPAAAPAVTPTAPTPTAPAPAPPAPAEAKCPECDKVFKSAAALKAHMGLAHKKPPAAAKPAEVPKPAPEAKPAEVAPPAAKPPEAKPAAVEFPEEAIRRARIAAIINKPYEEFKAYMQKEFPGIDVDALIKVVGVEVKDGKLVKVA